MTGIGSGIGIAGLGKMGRALAERVSAQGFQVAAWNRSGVEADWAEINRVTACDTLAGITEHAEIILLSLSDDHAVSSVLNQLLDTDLDGRLIVDCSTVNPAVLAGFAARVEAAGARLIDAPVSGWPVMVRQGKAGLYIGGADDDVDRFMPVATVVSNRIHHIGPLGQGMAAKIVNNMMLASYWQCLREAMQVGQSAGLSRQKMLDILTGGPAANGVLALKSPVILGETPPPSFTVSGIVGDLTMFNDVANAAGLETPALRAALQSFAAHAQSGAGAADFVTMVAAALDETKSESDDVL